MPPTPGVKASLPGELLADLLALVGEINGVLDPDELLPAIARNLRRIVDYRILDIFLPDPEGFLAPAYVEGCDLEVASRFRVRVGEGIVGAAAAAREPVFVPDVSQDSRYIPYFPGVVAELAIPLVSKDHLVGVLNIEGPAASPFTPAARTALQVLAGHLAVAIENATLYRETRWYAGLLATLYEIGKETASSRELRIAREIQHALFPEGSPSGAGWEASAHFRPARELGGDLYDFYDMGGGHLGVATGDVAGKGVPAALYAAFAPGTIRARAFERRAPADLMQRVNRSLRRRGIEGLFCTLAYALFRLPGRLVAGRELGTAAPPSLSGRRGASQGSSGGSRPTPASPPRSSERSSSRTSRAFSETTSPRTTSPSLSSRYSRR